ncbi:general secretion pathway protein GspB, partial [Acidovorax sp. sif0732]
RPADSKRAADKRGGTARERERPVAAVVVAPPAARAPAADPARPRESLGAPLPANGSAPRATQDPGAAPPPASPVFAQTDLPDTLRAQLPALKVTGATHSSNPVYRMAIVNGQVLHEGDQAAPGLVLEKIEPGRTVWTFRGYRYAVAAQ